MISPCGFNLSTAAEQALQLFQYPGWNELPAVRQNQVYATDANSYFARPGPRIVEGVELLSAIIHPAISRPTTPTNAFQRVPVPRYRSSLACRAQNPEIGFGGCKHTRHMRLDYPFATNFFL